MTCNHRVLVVDDDDDIRSIVCEVLRNEGYTVDEAPSGREALDLILATRDEPCIVLLDMMMPGMDGGEVLKALANHHRLAAMPVVIVSAQPQQTSPGVRRILRKPLSAELLLSVVAEFCRP